MRRVLVLICTLLGMPACAEDMPRLGIYGLVDSVSPLVVAGKQINLPDGYRVISPLGPSKSIELGDTLAITAEALGGQLHATRILEIYPIVGPVSAVRETVATVMGSAVHIPPDTSIKVGEWIALSGLWSGDTVITTNIRRVEGGGFGHLAGVIDEANLQIGSSDVRDAQWPDDGFVRDIWLLSGTPDETGLSVRLMAQGVFGSPVDMVLWQGYASAPIASQTYAIHGTGVIGTAHDAEMPTAGTLIIRCSQAGRVLHAAPDGMQQSYDALECARRIQAD